MAIELCEYTYELITDDLMLSELREFEIKGFGTKRLYAHMSELPNRE